MVRASSVIAALLLLARLAAEPVAALDVDARPTVAEDRYGLRYARALGDDRLELLFGDSCVAAIAAQPAAYRVLSVTDARYRAGVAPSAATDAAEDDGAVPSGWSGRAHRRHRVTLRLPQPLNAGDRYWVQALGAGGRPITGGRAAAWIEPLDDAAAAVIADDGRLGVRSLELIAPTMLRATVGDGLDAGRLDGRPAAVAIISDDDPAYASGRAPVRIGRVSRGECLYPDGWPYGFYQRHELWLAVDPPLRDGRTYRVDLARDGALTLGRSSASLTIDDRACVNPAIKVNQVGYLPDAVVKRAFLGAWMGPLGAFDWQGCAARFEVRDERTDRVVLAGTPRLRHRRAADETALRIDLTGEDVYELDLSALSAAGRYYVAVPGCGRSLAFAVAGDVYRRPFAVMMNGVLHQRCGLAMTAPWSHHPRAACHRAMTEPTDLPRGSESDAHRLLPAHALPGAKLDLFGGHHDAGDYNPRSHLEIAELAFMAYELHPAAFADRQLLVPEAGNGVPDLLDEGRWALDLWSRLQRDDGAVRAGTESNGDPDQTTPPDLDPLRDFAFAPDPAASFRFAACAAQAATLWRGLGRAADADDWLARSRRAWAWAAAQPGTAGRDERALAAVQLYRCTGEAGFLAAFAASTPFADGAGPGAASLARRCARDSAFWYVRCARPVDEALRTAIRGAFAGEAAEWAASADTAAYPYIRHPRSGFTWGTGAHPTWLAEFIQAAVVTGDPRLRTWIEQTCDFALGCNPMNLVFTVGLGQRSIAAPLHLYGRFSPDGPIAGIQCQGPSAQTGGSAAGGGMGTWIGRMLAPTGPWPVLQTYCDVGMIPGMNEGLVVDEMRCAFAYAYLLPDAVGRPTPTR